MKPKKAEIKSMASDTLKRIDDTPMLDKIGGVMEEAHKREMWKSFVKITPANKGYFIQIGDDYTKHSWAITQDELEKLLTECKKYTKNKEK